MPNKTILFADDSATMRTIMEKTFAAEPFDILAVPSGEAAIAKARESKPDVVIVDAGMAGVNGYDVCEALRQDAAISQTPIIVMSGVSSPYDEEKGRSVGVTEHVKKPFDTTQLIEKVTQLASAAPAAAPKPVAPEPPAAAPKPVAPKPPAAVPQVAAPKPPAAPVEPVRPPAVPGVRPIAAASKPSIKGTMEFGRPPAAKPSPPPAPEEPAPIEIDTETPASEGAFQVGTLAELAQMDDKGTPIRPDVGDGAIELGGPSAPVVEPAPSVKAAAAAAAAEVAAKVDGLTPEQAEAIRKLTEDVVEQIVWEVVPDLAEAIIREELAKLISE